MGDAALIGNTDSKGCAFANGGPAAPPDQVVPPILAQCGCAATTSPEFSTATVAHVITSGAPMGANCHRVTSGRQWCQ
jgi:hypothetical protein